MVKGSGKVEQAKNIKARKLGNRKNRSESRDNLERQESNFAETKKGRAAEGQSNGALRGLFRHQHQWILETLKHTLKHL